MLHRSPNGSHRPRKPRTPLISVVVVDEANRRSPPPKRRKERKPIRDIDDKVSASEASAAEQGRSQVLGVGPTCSMHPILVVPHGAPADEVHFMATFCQAAQEPVDHQLGPTSLGMDKIPPTDHDNVHPVQTSRCGDAGSKLRRERREPLHLAPEL